jgi:hypothetical protein
MLWLCSRSQNRPPPISSLDTADTADRTMRRAGQQKVKVQQRCNLSLVKWHISSGNQTQGKLRGSRKIAIRNRTYTTAYSAFLASFVLWSSQQHNAQVRSARWLSLFCANVSIQQCRVVRCSTAGRAQRDRLTRQKLLWLICSSDLLMTLALPGFSCGTQPRQPWG